MKNFEILLVSIDFWTSFLIFSLALQQHLCCFYWFIPRPCSLIQSPRHSVHSLFLHLGIQSTGIQSTRYMVRKLIFIEGLEVDLYFEDKLFVSYTFCDDRKLFSTVGNFVSWIILIENQNHFQNFSLISLNFVNISKISNFKHFSNLCRNLTAPMHNEL